jgi:ADP-heptose:LPS heptosyltransferase
LLVDAVPTVAIVIVGVERTGRWPKHSGGLPPERCLNLAGRTRSLIELVELLNRGAALVTIDSGPAHFSGLSGISRVVLFGPETPALYGPVGDRVEVGFANLSCSPCFSAANHRTSSCTDNQCLSACPEAGLRAGARGALTQTRAPGDRSALRV